MCLCSETIRLSQLANTEQRLTPQFEDRILRLVPDLEALLSAIHVLSTKSKCLPRKLTFQIRVKKTAAESRRQRTGVIFRNWKFDFSGQEQVYELSKNNFGAFWKPPNLQRLPSQPFLQDVLYSTLHYCLQLDGKEAHRILFRRLSTVVVSLLLRVLPNRYTVDSIASTFHNAKLFPDLSEDDIRARITEFSSFGNRYVSLALNVGEIGVIWLCPLEVSHTVWERWLPLSGVDNENVVKHFRKIGIARKAEHYSPFVKELLYHRIRPLFSDRALLETYLTPETPSHQIISPSNPSLDICSQSLLPQLPLEIQQRTISNPPHSTYEHSNLTGPLVSGWNDIRRMVHDDQISDNGYLFLLLLAFGNSLVPELLFTRTRSPQPRWNDSGSEHRVTALEAGIDKRLIEILADPSRLFQIIQSLSTVVHLNESDRTCSIKSDFTGSLSELTEQDKRKWFEKALRWVCFVFPRDQLWESNPSYGFAVRALLPLLEHTVGAVRSSAGLEACLRVGAPDALLAASKIGDLQSRQRLLALANDIIANQGPDYLLADAAHQQSVISRLAGNFDHSELVIHAFCCRAGGLEPSETSISEFYRQLDASRVGKRLNALLGRLHISHLENLVQCEKYNIAVEEVDDWKTSRPSSQMEVRLSPSKVLVVSKIYRSNGLFPEARTGLEACLKSIPPKDANRDRLLCNLSDVYCDLKLPEKAHELLYSEIERERRKGVTTKSLRRFLVSSLDADIQRNLFGQAESSINELNEIFGKLSTLDVSDQLMHVRVLVATARMYHCKSRDNQSCRERAKTSWETVLSHMERYKSFEGEGFTYAVVHLSISLVHAEAEAADMSGALAAFSQAQRILANCIRDYWIPTLAAWYEDVNRIMQQLTGWHIAPGRSHM